MKFSKLKYERKRVHFSPYEFLYCIDIYMVHEREKCTPLRSYVSRAVNVGADLNVYGNVSFVLYTINVECMCEASYVT